jgi:catechol 2,3-dioxygenase-like lactoylglutathione lyase family enzyme
VGVSRVNQLDLVVRDMDASVAFYRRLGLDVEHDIPTTYESLSADSISNSTPPARFPHGTAGGGKVQSYSASRPLPAPRSTSCTQTSPLLAIARNKTLSMHPGVAAMPWSRTPTGMQSAS